MSFYRNTKDVNERYRNSECLLDGHEKVFTTEKCYFFDEPGISKIYKENGYPFYEDRVFADISILRKRFTLAKSNNNYKYQVFYWENGNIFRVYLNDDVIMRDEFIYIHFKQRKYLEDLVKQKTIMSFYICNYGFFDKKLGIPTLDEIKKYNRFNGILYERMETFLKTVYNKLKLRYDRRFN